MKDVERSANKYSSSILLPLTNFSIRANAARREPELQKFWRDNMERIVSSKSSGKPFILHDGPPYANGDLHIGRYGSSIYT